MVYADRHYMYLTAGWPQAYPWTDQPHAPQPLAGCTNTTGKSPRQRRAHSLHRQIPALAQKLQSSLIMLGPRKDAVRCPQHGYNIRH